MFVQSRLYDVWDSEERLESGERDLGCGLGLGVREEGVNNSLYKNTE